jgi:chloride channel 3/4/5
LTTLPGPTDVLIKLNATGICHSDIHFMLNDWAVPKMSDLGVKCAGHEGSGVIVKVGDQVKNLKPGMRAGYKVRRPTILLLTILRPEGSESESVFKNRKDKR